jgi:hypothetical protein
VSEAEKAKKERPSGGDRRGQEGKGRLRLILTAETALRSNILSLTAVYAQSNRRIFITHQFNK